MSCRKAKEGFERYSAKTRSNPLKPLLFEGVTGSGKTEVYLSWLKECWPEITHSSCSDTDDIHSCGYDTQSWIARARVPIHSCSAQVLVLLPEIALTPQWIERFHRRFGFAPTVWHAHLTLAQRRDNWLSIALGKTRVIVGAIPLVFTV